MNLYDFTVKTMDGKDYNLSALKGKTVLVVNTATACGFTPQYTELQEIYDEFHAQGLEILDFPCNQFGEQAPGTDDEIHTFCTGRFGITFPQFSKIDVNGANAAPLFKWLTENTTFDGFDKLHPIGLILSQVVKKADPDYKNTSTVKWNFTKFLVDKEGNIVARFEPTGSMKKLRQRIRDELLK